jgi:hypothetical protein
VEETEGPVAISFPQPWFSDQTRTQILLVLGDGLGKSAYADGNWQLVRDKFDREMGTINIGISDGEQWAMSLCAWAIRRGDELEALDLIGLALCVAQDRLRVVHAAERLDLGITMDPDDAVREINRFLREGDVLYQFESGQWISVSSQYTHQQMVEPALAVLASPDFAGALQEFETAMIYVRSGDTKPAAVEATKALESTIKVICGQRGWVYAPNATLTPLVELIARHGLIEPWMKSLFLGPASIRNKLSAHGQGGQIVPLPRYHAELAVHLAAAFIVDLIAANNSQR